MSSLHLKRLETKVALEMGRRGSLHAIHQAGLQVALGAVVAGGASGGKKSPSPSARPEIVTEPKVLWKYKEQEKDPDPKKVLGWSGGGTYKSSPWAKVARPGP